MFSLNVTSKGSVHISIPNIDTDYVRALYSEGRIPLSLLSLRKFYSQDIMSTFLKWNKVIEGKSILGIYSNSLQDNSVQLFHKFARRWIFGTGEKSSRALAYICDVNSIVAVDLNRPDLKATWQVIKMLYTDYDGSRNYRINSSKTSRSLSKGFHINDTLGGQHHRHPPGRKFTSIDKQQQQQQENRLNDELIDDKRIKSQEQKNLLNSKLGKKMNG